MRWACQPSQSSTPASSPCGISVSPLRRVFVEKLLRSGDALIHGYQLGYVVRYLTSCQLLPVYLGVVLHRVQHPHGPARGAVCCAGAFVVLLVLGQFGSVGLAGNALPRPQTFQPMRWACQPRPEQHAGKQPLRDQRIARCVEFC